MGKAATIGAVPIGTITITTTTGAASAPREPGLGEPVMPSVHEEPLEACALLASPQPTRSLEHIPPNLVVKSQTIDIAEVILSRIR